MVGTDSSSLPSSSEVEVVARLRLEAAVIVAFVAVFFDEVAAFFLAGEAAGAALEEGLLPPLMALLTEAGFSDCRPAVVFLGGDAVVEGALLPLREVAEVDVDAFFFLDELAVSSSATSSESDASLCSSSFSSSSSSSSVSTCSLLLRRAGASFSSVGDKESVSQDGYNDLKQVNTHHLNCQQ